MFYSEYGKKFKKNNQLCSNCVSSVSKDIVTQPQKRYKLPIIMLVMLILVGIISGCKSDPVTDSFRDSLPDTEQDANTTINDPDTSIELDEVNDGFTNEFPPSSDESQSSISDPFFYTGTWSDSYSQRCYMTVEEFGESSYSIEIHWSSSASTDTVWYMIASLISESTDLEYKNCVAKNQIYDENGNLSDTVLYVDGTGKFYYDGSYLHWQDDKEGAGNQCRFVKEGIDSGAQDSSDGYEDSVRFDTEFYSLTLPKYWADLSVYEQWDIAPYSYGISFYETQSCIDFDGEGGFLFSIALYNNEEDYMDFPDYTYLGQLRVVRLANYDVVVFYPTDVQFSDAGRENYMKLSNDIDGILASFAPQPDVDCEYIPAN